MPGTQALRQWPAGTQVGARLYPVGQVGARAATRSGHLTKESEDGEREMLSSVVCAGGAASRVAA